MPKVGSLVKGRKRAGGRPGRWSELIAELDKLAATGAEGVTIHDFETPRDADRFSWAVKRQKEGWRASVHTVRKGVKEVDVYFKSE